MDSRLRGRKGWFEGEEVRGDWIPASAGMTEVVKGEEGVHEGRPYGRLVRRKRGTPSPQSSPRMGEEGEGIRGVGLFAEEAAVFDGYGHASADGGGAEDD